MATQLDNALVMAEPGSGAGTDTHQAVSPGTNFGIMNIAEVAEVMGHLYCSDKRRSSRGSEAGGQEGTAGLLRFSQKQAWLNCLGRVVAGELLGHLLAPRHYCSKD